MAVKLPLNKFRSKFVPLNASEGLTHIYEAPERRATIIIMAQVTNTTGFDRTVTVGVSSNKPINLDKPIFSDLVKDFPIPANDARSILAGRLVVEGSDNDSVFSSEVLYAADTTTEQGDTGLILNLGLLETVNFD